MSYILEALRRADSERERGGVPDINARPLPTELSDAPRGGPLSHPLVWVFALLALLLAAMLGWQLLREDPPAVSTAAPPSATAAPAAVGPTTPPAPLAPAPVARTEPAAPAVTATTAAPAPTPAPADATADAARAAPVIVPPAARELLAAEEAASRQRAARSAAASAAPAPAPAPAPAAVAPAAAAAPRAGARDTARPAAAPTAASASADAAIVGLRDLPEDVRRALPALAIGGSVYSANPSGRFVVVNGQIVHEGDRLGPDLALEQIRLKSAVLRFKGYRFEIDY